MASKDYFLDLNTKVITLPDSRWYETPEGNFASVTTKLGAHSKPGLASWQITMAELGADVKKLGTINMDEGSEVHKLTELYDKREKVCFYDDIGIPKYDFWKVWKPFLNYVEAKKEFKIEPIFIEQTIWSSKFRFAGTLDRLAWVTLPNTKNKRLAIIDLKRSSSVSIDYQWQIAAYSYALNEMYYENNHESLKDFKAFIKNALGETELKSLSEFILLLNTDSKKGYRLTQITDIEQKLKMYLHCNALWDGENPNFEMSKKIYPTEVQLIKEEEINNHE